MDTTNGTAATPGTTTTSDASLDTLLTDETTETVADKAADAGITEGDKAPGDDKAGDQSSIDTYADFVMPEGIELDAALLSEATPLFKELKLTQEQAQKLVDFQAKQVQAGSQAQVDAFNKQLQDWRTEASHDKEFGGDKFNENLAVARSAISKFGTPELKQLLRDYGVGNHPEVIRFMVRVGKLTTEDVPGNRQTPVSNPTDWASQLYPSEKSA